MDPSVKNKIKEILPILFYTIATIFIIPAFFHFVFLERILPNTYVGNVNIGGLTKDEAVLLLEQKIKIPSEIILAVNKQNIKIDLNEIDLNYNFGETAKKAYLKRYNENPLKNLESIYQKTYIDPIFSYNRDNLDKLIINLEEKIEQKGKPPEAKIENGQIKIINGVAGILIDKKNLKENLEEKFKNFDFSKIELKTISDNYVLDEENIKNYEERVKKLIDKKIVLSFEDFQEEIKDAEIVSLTDYFEGYKKEKIEEIQSRISQKIERPAQNPIFNFENEIVKEFQPAKDGVVVNKEEFTSKLISSLSNLENSEEKTLTFDIPVIRTPPEYKTEEVNSLGIKELVGIGKSKFVGSIPSRVHNIKLATSKFNGILVKPDEIFSFNQILGEVSKETGYQQAYIIKGGQTVLGDGGGVCQVSTTLFRALLNAGLPILERQAHAYRVGYYEQDSPPGFDATVFSPSPDLKFKNDTPAHLLIQTKLDTTNKTLTFEIYGTKDNREVFISKANISNITPPPEDLYIDDPSLPIGKITQIDWKAWGAKVWFDYKVTKDNQEIFSKRFYSNYRPWQAKFLRGTGTTQ
jgi:vancomycin resistance protein YoaR